MPHMKAFHSDIVLKANIENDQGYICFINEAQSKPEKLMVLRLIEYTCCVIREHIQSGEKHFPIVIPIVYYSGS